MRNLAAQYHADIAHTEHVAELALAMWDELGSGDPAERELLWAAAMLHDIGIAIDYDDHHKHSRYLILNAGLPGFSPRETALIGQMARYHRKGSPTLGQFSALGRKGDDELLTRCAAVLRLAEQLERSRDQAVDRVAGPAGQRAREAAPGGARGRLDRALGRPEGAGRVQAGVRARARGQRGPGVSEGETVTSSRSLTASTTSSSASSRPPSGLGVAGDAHHPGRDLLVADHDQAADHVALLPADPLEVEPGQVDAVGLAAPRARVVVDLLRLADGLHVLGGGVDVGHQSKSTPGLRRPAGSSADLAARSAAANGSGRWRSYHGRWSRPTAWWWVIVPPPASTASAAARLISAHCSSSSPRRAGATTVKYGAAPSG